MPAQTLRQASAADTQPRQADIRRGIPTVGCADNQFLDRKALPVNVSQNHVAARILGAVDLAACQLSSFPSHSFARTCGIVPQRTFGTVVTGIGWGVVAPAIAVPQFHRELLHFDLATPFGASSFAGVLLGRGRAGTERALHSPEPVGGARLPSTVDFVVAGQAADVEAAQRGRGRPGRARVTSPVGEEMVVVGWFQIALFFKKNFKFFFPGQPVSRRA